MTRRNSLPMTAEDVEKHNATVRALRNVKSNPGHFARQFISEAAVDDELRSLGVPIDLLLDKGVLAKADLPAIHATAIRALKRTRMNKLEAEWAMRLEVRERAGEILWYGFEAIKLRLADNTHYTPDFAVLGASLQLKFHETKGFWRDDARVKIKVAAEMFPYFKFYAIKKKRKKDGGGWDIEGF